MALNIRLTLSCLYIQTPQLSSTKNKKKQNYQLLKQVHPTTRSNDVHQEKQVLSCLFEKVTTAVRTKKVQKRKITSSVDTDLERYFYERKAWITKKKSSWRWTPETANSQKKVKILGCHANKMRLKWRGCTDLTKYHFQRNKPQLCLKKKRNAINNGIRERN